MDYLRAPKCTFSSVFDFKKDLKWKKKRSKINSVTMDEDEIDELRQSSSQKQQDRRKAGQVPNRGQTGPDRNQRPESSKRVWTRWYFISVHFRAENYWSNEKQRDRKKVRQRPDNDKTGYDRNWRPGSGKKVWTRWQTIVHFLSTILYLSLLNTTGPTK